MCLCASEVLGRTTTTLGEGVRLGPACDPFDEGKGLPKVKCGQTRIGSRMEVKLSHPTPTILKVSSRSPGSSKVKRLIIVIWT